MNIFVGASFCQRNSPNKNSKQLTALSRSCPDYRFYCCLIVLKIDQTRVVMEPKHGAKSKYLLHGNVPLSEKKFSCRLTMDQCVYWFCMSNLYSRLCEFRPLSQFLSGVDVWVMRPFKSLLQLFQLLGGEGGATAPLLPLQGQVRLRFYIWTIICAVNWNKNKLRKLLWQVTEGCLLQIASNVSWNLS